MFEDLTNSKSRPNLGLTGSTTAHIKSWAKQHWQLPEGATLLVSELECGETDCPDVETVIAVLAVSGTDKTVKLNKPIYSINEADIKSIDIWRKSEA